MRQRPRAIPPDSSATRHDVRLFALRQARDGDLAGAQRSAWHACQLAKARHGDASPEHCRGLVDVAIVLWHVDQPERARACLEAAQQLAVELRDSNATLDELADVIVGVPHVPVDAVAQLLLVRAERLVPAGRAAFSDLQWLPDEALLPLLEQLVDALSGAPRPSMAEVESAIAAQLEHVIAERSREPRRLIRSLNLARNSAAYRAGRFDLRVEPLAWLRDDSDRKGERDEALRYQLDLCLAHAALDKRAEAVECAEDAVGRARSLGSPDLLCKALCDVGVLHERWGRTERAESLFLEAFDTATERAPTRAGEAAAALGLCMHHRRSYAEARSWLERGVARLRPFHPYALLARCHLESQPELNTDCCAGLDKTLSAALSEHVQREAPGLVSELRVWHEAGRRRVHVVQAPMITHDQRDELQTVIERAMREIDGGFASLA